MTQPKQPIINSVNLQKDLEEILKEFSFDRLFILTDSNTNRLSLPLLQNLSLISQHAHIIKIPSDDKHKTLDTVAKVWTALCDNGATRHSLLINLGGGMLTDLGGFAASTFKRGIRFINLPTTLLGAVDAAVGGKTGINFLHYKNEIGTFAPACAVVIHAPFFKTLDHTNLLSGYAELLKHALLKDQEAWKEAIEFDVDNICYDTLQELLMKSVKVKEEIVLRDPLEKNIRKALNLGHTFAHAFESFSMSKNTPIPHGYAVAWGLVCDLYLSCKKCGFPKEVLWTTTQFIRKHYGTYPCSCQNYDQLIELMRHDKKNTKKEEINFTLLSNIGDIRINQTAMESEICEAIDFMRENTGG